MGFNTAPRGPTSQLRPSYPQPILIDLFGLDRHNAHELLSPDINDLAASEVEPRLFFVESLTARVHAHRDFVPVQVSESPHPVDLASVEQLFLEPLPPLAPTSLLSKIWTMKTNGLQHGPMIEAT